MVGTGIAMMIVSIATKIYTDNGGPGLAIYRPHCPPGFCILGDYAQEGDIDKPNHGVMLCILMQQNSTVVAEAQGFAQVWSSEGPESGHGYGDDEGPETTEGSSGSASGQNDILAFWRPIGPNEDYVALGHVATTSYEPPSYDHVCVVHKSAVIAGIPGRRVWIEESRMASLWSMALSYHYLNLGMFFSSDSKAAPRITQFWSLLPEVVPAPQNTSLSIKKLTKDDLTLLYKGQECRTSKILSVYLPRAPIGYAPLGHYAERGFSRASQVTPMLVVKEMGGKGLLRHPVTFQELWRSDANNTDAAIWRPVPPPGYFCVGHVLGVGSEAPPTNSTECLHWSVIGRGWPSRSKRVWWNKCSPGRDATIWRVSGLDDCLSAGTFVIHRGLHNPHWEELLFHCFYLNEVSVR